MGNVCSFTREEMSTFTVRGKKSLIRPVVTQNRCRKGKDYTYLYGSHVGTGSLTPYVYQALHEKIHEYA